MRNCNIAEYQKPCTSNKNRKLHKKKKTTRTKETKKKLMNNFTITESEQSSKLFLWLLKDVRAQNFPRTDFVKTLTAGRE